SRTTTTAGNGGYLFTGLVPGTYKVTFSGLPSGYVFTAKDVGANGFDAIDSDADTSTGMTGNYTLQSGDSNLTVDAGAYRPVSVGDFVWDDSNANGIQDAGETGINGVTVALTGTTGAGVAVSLTTTTAGNGGYLFSNLAPGTYTVSINNGQAALNGFTPTTVNAAGTTTANDSHPNPSRTSPSALPSGANHLTVAFGYYKPASLGDYVWLDQNRNGKQDSGEPGVAGVTVTLYTRAGVQVGSPTTTDATGFYKFTGLVPGDYYVVFSTSGA